MKNVNYGGEIQNEYTVPLVGEPYYCSSGFIFATDQNGDRYAVSRIDLERYDDQNFQYVFSPKWSVIDSLPASIFQGIPGLDLSLRLEHYYRVNMTPYFVAERTPGENREDLWELLEKVGLDYYDRFEWLLRTNMRSGTDNLIVERANIPGYYEADANQLKLCDLQPTDFVAINSLDSLASTSSRLSQCLLQILRSGAKILDKSENRVLSDEECSILLKLLIIQNTLKKKENELHQQEGIEKAKKAGKYSGRKRIPIDQHLLLRVASDFEKQLINEAEAMRRLGISSRSTFYRRLRELKQIKKAGT